MPDDSRPITLEHALYALALAAGLGFRLLHLGALPLSDLEADGAMQALQIVRGGSPAIGANAAYVHLTAVLFYLLEPTNFLARLWPALAGASLVLLPLAFRDRLGKLPALLLACGLAIDPGLAALSRQAAGPMPAIAALAWAWAAWRGGRRALAGVAAGLALLSGPAAWFGLLVLLAGFLSPPQPGAAPARPRWPEVRVALAWAVGTILLAGTLFGLSLAGLGTILAGPGAFLGGWRTTSGVPALHLLAALPAYAPLALVFGLVGLARGLLARKAATACLGAWLLAGLLLALVYPGRQVADLVWVLLPLWGLAALELGHHFDFAGRNLWEVAGAAILSLALLTSAWFYLLGMVNLNLGLELGQTRLLILIGLVAMLALALVLVAYGWTPAVARLGAVWGGGAMLFFLTLASLTGATGLRQPTTVELWTPPPQVAQADLLLETVDEISTWNEGLPGALPLTLAGVDSPALRWLLRDYDLTLLSFLAPGATPALVITPEAQLGLTAAYRGQDFAWYRWPNFSTSSARDWGNWYLFRRMGVQTQNIILWVRSDLQLGSQSPAAP